MIGWHCGAKMRPRWETSKVFAWYCIVCKKTFKQRKRQPLKKGEQHGNKLQTL